MEFAADAPKPATGGQVTLYINDRPVGKGRMDHHTVPIRFSAYAGMDIGRDNGGVVDLSYEDKKPFPFTGTITKVIFDINPHPLATPPRTTTKRSWPAAVTCTGRWSSARTSRATCRWNRPTTWSARALRAWAPSGFAVGLFAPPLLAATAVGAVIGAGPANCCTAKPPASWKSRSGPPSRSAALA